MTSLQANAEQLCSGGRRTEALALVRDYAGPLAKETEWKRKELVRRLRSETPANEEDASRSADFAAGHKEAGQAQLKARLDEVAGDLLKMDLAVARKKCQAMLGDETLSSVHGECAVVAATVGEVAGMPQIILKSFTQDVGKEVMVTLKSGVERLSIIEVAGGEVKAAKEGSDGAERTFRAGDLAPQEKMRRLGREATPAAAIMRGLLRVEAGDNAQAEKEFTQAGGALGEALKRMLDEAPGVAARAPAPTASNR
jgi:hypothetical protein